ncbi:antA/AntB antirepressor family protein [Campylobacter showae]|jgi:phage transcriptional regulator|uniref:antA/AntB antirepressor family protein n=1 Tax=Campylobacter showae TaxID=204 RepID=UPI000F08FB68|nr:antA/AntB antirepressor family protein [Campylobacter showae]
MTELITINKADFNGAEINSVNARELHAVLESKTDFSTWIKRRLEETDAVENADYIIVPQKCETMTEHGKKASIKNEYILSTDIAKEIAMLERNEVGKKVRRYFIEFEKMHKQNFIPQDLPTALRAYANEVEQKELALKQRDQALATKAWIGSKREATAMATASAAKRENERLKVELDKSKEWASIKKVAGELGVMENKFRYADLRRKSNELGLDRPKIKDKNYPDGIRLYHKDVWAAVYDIDITKF